MAVAFLTNRSQFVSVEYSHSSHTKVVFVVPQGTVLGPTMFLIHINDVVNCYDLNTRIFAHDTVIYRTISSSADHDLLQHDLDNLESWATNWQMSFNATKWKLLSKTNKKPSKFAYSLGSETLSPTDEYDYLGVRCQCHLPWSSHCTKICNKTNKRLGLLRKTPKPCDKPVKEQVYLSMVRAIVEYATSAWSLYTDRDVSKLEQVQKNAGRFTGLIQANRKIIPTKSSLGATILPQMPQNQRIHKVQ